MVKTWRALGDRMLRAVLPTAEAKAEVYCMMVNSQCWKRCDDSCYGCNYDGGSASKCGCTYMRTFCS